MKKLFCSIFLISFLLLLTACKGNAPLTNEDGMMKTITSKEYVAEFIELLDEHPDLGDLSNGYVLDEEHCYNVTPDQVANETNMRIFKFSDSCASFVLSDNEIYPLCGWFGGYGFVNAVPCDFDNDGNKDLLVASSGGSGIHRSVISVFNSASKESTIVYDTATTDTPDTDLFVVTAVPSLSSKKMEDLPIYYHIYSARIETNNENLAELSYVATGFVGSIEGINGTPAFKPYNEDA